MSHFDAAAKRELRGKILAIIQENHDSQRSRMTDGRILAVLRNLSFDVVLNEVITLLQDLQTRTCLKFVTLSNERIREVRIQEIEMLPRGVNILEGTETDPGIEIPRSWRKQ